MDTHIRLDCVSWTCLDSARSTIVDVLYRNQIFREVRAFDRDVFILSTSRGEHDVIAENVLIELSPRTVRSITWGRKYGRETSDERPL